MITLPAPIPGLERPFPREEGELRCGDHPLSELADEFGTPLYVYDAQYLEDRYRAFTGAFDSVDLLVAYSVKANGNLALLTRLGGLGAGADIVSGGELFRARKAGIPPERIVFSGVGKIRDEMEFGLREGIYAFNVESTEELFLLEEVARSHGVAAPVGIRVNPDILADTPHEYTRTGHKRSKFGVPPDTALDLYRWAADRPHVHLRGIDVHIGSQIVEVEPYLEALDTVLGMVRLLEDDGVSLAYVDLGGGFGVGYQGEPGLPLEAMAGKILLRLRARMEGGRPPLRLLLEPGRAVVGEPGMLLTRVLFRKEAGGKTFVIADGGMTELLRPSHYDGWHRVLPVHLRGEALSRRVDLVGPICESGDFLARDREIPLPEPGDLLAVGTAGAYGFSMASNYNARRRPAEVLVEGDQVHLVRRREELADLIRGEEIPPLPTTS